MSEQERVWRCFAVKAAKSEVYHEFMKGVRPRVRVDARTTSEGYAITLAAWHAGDVESITMTDFDDETAREFEGGTIVRAWCLQDYAANLDRFTSACILALNGRETPWYLVPDQDDQNLLRVWHRFLRRPNAIEETANAMGIEPQSVKNRLSRLRKQWGQYVVPKARN